MDCCPRCPRGRAAGKGKGKPPAREKRARAPRCPVRMCTAGGAATQPFRQPRVPRVGAGGPKRPVTCRPLQMFQQSRFRLLRCLRPGLYDSLARKARALGRFCSEHPPVTRVPWLVSTVPKRGGD